MSSNQSLPVQPPFPEWEGQFERTVADICLPLTTRADRMVALKAEAEAAGREALSLEKRARLARLRETAALASWRAWHATTEE